MKISSAIKIFATLLGLAVGSTVVIGSSASAENDGTHVFNKDWKLDGEIRLKANNQGLRLERKRISTLGTEGRWTTEPASVLDNKKSADKAATEVTSEFQFRYVAGAEAIYEVTNNLGNKVYASLSTRQWAVGGKYTTCALSRDPAAFNKNNLEHHHPDRLANPDHFRKDAQFLLKNEKSANGTVAEGEFATLDNISCRVNQLVKDKNSHPDQKAAEWKSFWEFSVQDQAPAVTTEALPDVHVNAAYEKRIQSTGVPAPKLKVVHGSLPYGLHLDDWGRITGTPTSQGLSTFGVQSYNALGMSEIKHYKIDVK